MGAAATNELFGGVFLLHRDSRRAIPLKFRQIAYSAAYLLGS